MAVGDRWVTTSESGARMMMCVVRIHDGDVLEMNTGMKATTTDLLEAGWSLEVSG